MPFVQLSTGIRMHYIDTGGEGLPIMIVLHGLLGTAEKDLGRVVDWLRPHFRVLGPTLRGYAESEPETRTFTVDFYRQDMRDIVAFIEALDVAQAHILGYSDGGETAMLVAAAIPERVLSLVTIGSVGYFGPEMRPVAQRLFPGDWITDEECQMHNIARRETFILGWIKAVVAMIDAGGDVALSVADRISAPFLLILGERDTLNPEAYGQQMVARTAQGRVRMFPAGHGVHDDCWDEFKAVVGDFLKLEQS